MNNVEVTSLNGTTKLESIHFRDSHNLQVEKILSDEGIIEQYYKPDLVICENGVGRPKVNINDKFA